MCLTENFLPFPLIIYLNFFYSDVVNCENRNEYLLNRVTHKNFFLITDILQKLMEYTKRYGNLLRIYFPPYRPCVLISDNEIVQEILLKHKVLGKSKSYEIMKVWLGEGLLTVSGMGFVEKKSLLINFVFKMSLKLESENIKSISFSPFERF